MLSNSLRSSCVLCVAVQFCSQPGSTITGLDRVGGRACPINSFAVPNSWDILAIVIFRCTIVSFALSFGLALISYSTCFSWERLWCKEQQATATPFSPPLRTLSFLLIIPNCISGNLRRDPSQSRFLVCSEWHLLVNTLELQYKLHNPVLSKQTDDIPEIWFDQLIFPDFAWQVVCIIWVSWLIDGDARQFHCDSSGFWFIPFIFCFYQG